MKSIKSAIINHPSPPIKPIPQLPTESFLQILLHLLHPLIRRHTFSTFGRVASHVARM